MRKMLNMTATSVLKAHKAVEKARSELEKQELALSGAVAEWIAAAGGSTAASRQLGFSIPYVSDIAAGRRKVSDKFVKALREAK